MRREERIYTAVNSIPELTNKTFWAYISEEESEELKTTTSCVISLTDRQVVYTLEGLTPVRSTYVVDIRGETAIQCEGITDSVVEALSDGISDYTIIGVFYDPDLERVRIRFTIQVNE